MIRVRAALDVGHVSIDVSGHEDDGKDPDLGRICAAVSAIGHTCVLGLEQLALHHPGQVQIEVLIDGVPE